MNTGPDFDPWNQNWIDGSLVKSISWNFLCDFSLFILYSATVLNLSKFWKYFMKTCKTIMVTDLCFFIYLIFFKKTPKIPYYLVKNFKNLITIRRNLTSKLIFNKVVHFILHEIQSQLIFLFTHSTLEITLFRPKQVSVIAESNVIRRQTRIRCC